MPQPHIQIELLSKKLSEMQIMQDFLKHVLIYALKDRNKTNIERMAARYLWSCKWRCKNWFVYPIGNIKTQNSIKCLVERFKWEATWFLWMSWKISPVDKHSFPEYIIYFRMAICTAATGQGLDGISLGIQKFWNDKCNAQTLIVIGSQLELII